jgi:hypothetical protein
MGMSDRRVRRPPPNTVCGTSEHSRTWHNAAHFARQLAGLLARRVREGPVAACAVADCFSWAHEGWKMPLSHRGICLEEGARQRREDQAAHNLQLAASHRSP